MQKRQRGIDHLVLPVRDLQVAVNRYQSLGFTLTPIAEHPWGTLNALVQLQGNFLELLTVGPHYQPAAKQKEKASSTRLDFGEFNHHYLQAREGFSQLVFESADARADQTEFSAAGLQTYDNFDFSRQAKLPDGSQVEVAFSLAFVMHEQMPDCGFFTCQQHAPQYFWKPQYQTHSNGAQLISEVIMVADQPQAFADFMAALHGGDAITDSNVEKLSVSTARGLICVLTPHAYRERFAPVWSESIAHSAPQGPHFCAYQINSSSLDQTRQSLQAGGCDHADLGDRILIGADSLHGVALEFTGSELATAQQTSV